MQPLTPIYLFYFILFYFISFHFISSHFISLYFILFVPLDPEWSKLEISFTKIYLLLVIENIISHISTVYPLAAKALSVKKIIILICLLSYFIAIFPSSNAKDIFLVNFALLKIPVKSQLDNLGQCA